MNTFARRSIALLLLASVAACGGGNASSPSNALPSAKGIVMRPAVNHMFDSMVGVGDSLTAGYQSGGFLGALNVRNPEFPGGTIPPGQESGFWADLYEQATGTSPDVMYKPAMSPLPLIAGPGLDNQVVPSIHTVFAVSKSGNPCTFDGGFDQSAFSLSGLKRVRLNAGSTHVRDLGVPGITLHEAVHMTQPLTPTCNALPGTAGLLSAVTNGESGVFYPVLGDFAPRLNANLNMVTAAHLLNPTMVTIWLGANDVLKFMGSGGLFRGGDMTAAQAQADLSPIIGGFSKNNHAAVAVANLPDVLLTPYFMNMEIPSNPNVCAISPAHQHMYFYCLLVQFGRPPALAAKVTKQIRNEYGLLPASGKCVPASLTAPCGYLTLQGALAVIAALLAVPPQPIPNLDPSGPGSGLGNHYITPAFAAQIQAINDNVNDGIAAAANANHVALVDIKTIFEGLASEDPNNPYFKLVQINPGVCCSLQFLGGLVSYDGLHPSNTGYAVISDAFIQAINKTYGANIPRTPIEKIYAGKPPYKFMDPYAPQVVHDLEIVRSGKTYVIHYAAPRHY